MIIVNGKNYEGNNLYMNGDKVYVEGKLVSGDDEKEVNIIIDGNIDTIKLTSVNNFNMVGNCNNLSSTGGNLNIKGSIEGNVTSVSGNIKCKSINGNVSTVSGDISKRIW